MNRKRFFLKLFSFFCSILVYLKFLDFSYPIIYMFNNFDVQNIDINIEYLLRARDDFVNIILFIFLVLFIEYFCWKDERNKTGDKIKLKYVILGMIKDLCAIFLAISVISYWFDLYGYVWSWQSSYRIFPLDFVVLTYYLILLSSFLFIVFDPLTPIIYNTISGKTFWRFIKSKLISIGIVYCALSTRLVFTIEEYLPTLLLWIGLNMFVWINYIRASKNKVSNDPI